MVRLLPFLFLLIAYIEVYSTDPIEEKKLQHKELEAEIRRLFDAQAVFLPEILRLRDDELLCKCNNFDGCGKDDVKNVIGENYTGVCRPGRGGSCSRVVYRNKNGAILEMVTSCLHRDQMVPRELPFVCQNQTTSHMSTIVTCCKSGSFCNDFEFPIELGAEEVAGVAAWALSASHLYLLLMFLVSVMFSAMGLCVGIFYCSPLKAKAFFGRCFGCLLPCHRRVVDRLRDRQFENVADSNSGLANQRSESVTSSTQLGQFLRDTTISTGSGAGVPLLEPRTITRQIALKGPIGRGGFGNVYMGEWRGENVAVKVFSSSESDSWSRETDIYHNNMLRHPNLLRWIISDNKDTGMEMQYWLVTEFCPFGSLYDHLEKNTLTLQLGLQFIRSVAHGLAYLHTEVPDLSNKCHKPAIAHRDIKSRNILIKNDRTCCIGDLGMCICFAKNTIDKPQGGDNGGTARYLAPEFLAGSYNPNSFTAYLQMDIYALALVIWEILRRVHLSDSAPACEFKVPYHEYVDREPSPDMMRQIVCVEGLRPTIPKQWTDPENKIVSELTRIITESWSPIPQSRLTALNIRCTLDRICAEGGVRIIT